MDYSEQANISAKVKSLTQQLVKADGNIPQDFSRQDMDLFLQEGNPKLVAEIMENIYNQSEAIPLPDSSDDVMTRQADTGRSETFTEYNMQTGEVKERSFSEILNDFDCVDVSPTDTVMDEVKPIASITPRAWPNYWHEENPQNYDDTRTTCRIIIKIKSGGQATASGYLVSNTTLLTASHCIYNPSIGGWCDYLIVMPATSTKYPTGYYGTAATSTTVVVGNYYIKNTLYRGDDWGIVKLNKSFSIGFLATKSYGSGSHVGIGVRVQGYPNANTSVGNGNMYLHCGTGTKDYSDYYKACNAKAYDGMSGGPILADGYKAIGIISGGNSSSVAYVAFDANLHNVINSYK